MLLAREVPVLGPHKLEERLEVLLDPFACPFPLGKVRDHLEAEVVHLVDEGAQVRVLEESNRHLPVARELDEPAPDLVGVRHFY